MPGDLQTIHAFLSQIKGMECWHVSVVFSSFSLALGQRIPRPVPLIHGIQDAEFSRFMGEAAFLVWCTWRLDGHREPLGSCDEPQHAIKARLKRLVGKRIESFEITEPAYDMTIRFSGEENLRVFCDHIPPDPSLKGNWELAVRNQTLYVGPGYTWDIVPERRDESSRPLDNR